ncbi:glycosyltransferase family 2 protein [Magnetofaba australis]|uniref:Putative glycosyltransferase n=1 Tax=Magnetofaba australis IT-1 TaxID=1434232 RepID=A0A1Y2K8S6_9PROT|nr:glycosyltransferase family 2 protein [Magnetofaba australis]OSM05076.1 putative glycosyltransferase [Magnetofaba australis IT-1]
MSLITAQERPAGLSAIIIGRNEAANLPRCLGALGGVVDEIVYVDTGSTDDSAQIAESSAARVFHRPWDDDFSAAKNHAIAQAKFRWLLSLDCDEELVPHSATNLILKEWRANLDSPGAIVRIENIMGDSAQRVPQNALRLFLNDDRIRFQNPIHEDVSGSIYRHWPQTPLPRLPITILHHGYAAGRNQEKLQRNMEILGKWADAEPDYPFAQYKYGKNLLHVGRAQEAWRYLQRAVTLINNDAQPATYAFLDALVEDYREAAQLLGIKEKVPLRLIEALRLQDR